MPWIEPVELIGTRVRLVPATREHCDALSMHAEPDTFRLFPAPIPDPPDGDGFARWLDSQRDRGWFPFATLVDGEPMGTTTFLDIRPEHRGLEIGATWLAPSARGTGANTEAKLLLLTHAFETLGAARVQFKTDSRNARSRAAIAKIGAKEEGTLRRHLFMPDGSWRDSVMFSIIEEEWAGVKARLRSMLGR